MKIARRFVVLMVMFTVSCATSPSIPQVEMEDVPCVQLKGHGVAYDDSIVKLSIADGALSGVTLEFYKASLSKDLGRTNYVFNIVGPRYRDDVYWIYTIDDTTGQVIHKFEYYSLDSVCGWSVDRRPSNSFKPNPFRGSA